MSPRPTFDLTPLFQRKVRNLRVVAAVLLAGLTLRVAYLQLLRGAWYLQRAKDNQEQRVVLPAERGEIFDRNYNPAAPSESVLAANRDSMDIFLVPGTLPPARILQTVSNLGRITGQPVEPLLAKVSNIVQGRPYLRYQPVLLLAGVPPAVLLRIAENNYLLPGVHWQNDPRRVYPRKSLAAHLLGYVGPINADELGRLRGDPLYHMQSVVGKAGVERQYDRELRGEDGEIVRIVDAHNRIKESFVSREPKPGRKVILNIDRRIQEIAETVLRGYTGAIIVCRPSTGEILALASSPTFDPNDFVRGIPADRYRRLAEDPSFPFLNRAVAAKYPASSTFKIITQTAALEEEVARPADRYYCDGHFVIGHDYHIFRCWNIHGWCDAVKALAVSCDIYYYNVGYLLGSEKITRYARLFGLGDLTGIDLPGESAGFIPSHAWKRRVFREAWYDGDTINLSIGQGFLLVTPVQMLNVINAVANDGVVYKPQVVNRILNPVDDRIERLFPPRIHRNVPVSRRNLELIRHGLEEVMRTGTGARAGRYSRIKVLGKTGTAQVHGREPHAWFIGYTPKDRYPDQYSIVVFVEHGGGGGDVAVPLALATLQAAILGENPAGLRRYFLSKTGGAGYRSYTPEDSDEAPSSARFRDVRF